MELVGLENFRGVDELVAHQKEVVARISALHDEQVGAPFTEEAREEFADLVERNREIDERITEFGARERYVREIARDPRNTESEAQAVALMRSTDRTVDREGMNLGLRAIERHSAMLGKEAGHSLEQLVRTGDPLGLGARYLDAVANPAYFTAFIKMLQDPTSGHLRFAPDEVEAVRRVSRVDSERAMSIGTGSAGGFGVPFQLDPSIIRTGTGALNPLRQIARVETTTEGTWKGVASDGVVAAYQAEAAEVADASPTLVQPQVIAQRGTCFVPFSIELQMDYSGLVSELGQLMADARDVLDATKMLLGTGTNEPGGILNIGGTGGLTTTQRVQTNTSATFAIADVYKLKQAIPPRFYPRATFAAHPTIWDVTYRFTGGASTEPLLLPTRDGAVAGIPKAEWSTFVTTTTTGSKIMLAGDFKAGVLICDRLGMSVEIVPHIFGATNRFPTGQRGLFAIYRTGSGVVAPAALRYLEVL
jgi:HK97 family phage major capsid protein